VLFFLLFKSVTEDKPQQSTSLIVREALALAAPFAGLSNLMTAAFGLVANLRERGVERL
jgi:hypothetical protein